MPPEKAREFLDKRRQSRTIYLTQLYTLLDEKSQTDTWTNEHIRKKTVFVTLDAVLVFADEERTNLIATYYPTN